jgi:hypothetical protein
MGLILDSGVIIAAERRGETVEQLIGRILRATSDQDAALSAVGLTELVHGIYRAPTLSTFSIDFLDSNRRLDASRSAPRGPASALRLLSLADQSVVLGVRPDPEPHDVCFVLHGERPIVQTNPH